MNINILYNISSFNITNSSKNNNFTNYNLNYDYEFIFILLLLILYSPIIVILLGLIKEFLYEIFKIIYEFLFKRLNRKKFIIKMGTIKHRVDTSSV